MIKLWPFMNSGKVLKQTRGRVWFVDNNAEGGADGRDWDNAYRTMAQAIANVQSNDVIYFVGNIREQIDVPANIFDVSIVGCGNKPRHSDLVAAGYGHRSQTSACWIAPVTASLTALTPLITVRHQGWRFENILFGWKSDSGTADAALVKLVSNQSSGVDEDDASHAAFINCRFDGGLTGIEDAGGCSYVLVDNCLFRGITDGTGSAIYNTDTGTRNPAFWEIRNCKFIDNDNHIVAKASKWFVWDNIFSADSVTTKISFSGGVAGNIVTRNLLGGTFSHAGGYTEAGAADEWAGNFNVLSGGVTAADPV